MESFNCTHDQLFPVKEFTSFIFNLWFTYLEANDYSYFNLLQTVMTRTMATLIRQEWNSNCYKLGWLTTVIPRLSSAHYDCLPDVGISHVINTDTGNPKKKSKNVFKSRANKIWQKRLISNWSKSCNLLLLSCSVCLNKGHVQFHSSPVFDQGLLENLLYNSCYNYHSWFAGVNHI